MPGIVGLFASDALVQALALWIWLFQLSDSLSKTHCAAKVFIIWVIALQIQLLHTKVSMEILGTESLDKPGDQNCLSIFSSKYL
jgi:hypothetical protein